MISYNSLPHNNDFQLPCIRDRLKTLLEKEKTLIIRIISFNHNFFFPYQTNFNILVIFIL